MGLTRLIRYDILNNTLQIWIILSLTNYNYKNLKGDRLCLPILFCVLPVLRLVYAAGGVRGAYMSENAGKIAVSSCFLGDKVLQCKNIFCEDFVGVKEIEKTR